MADTRTEQLTQEQFSRTGLLLGAEAMERLGKARVAVFGVGGVGGYVCEALARSGIGAFDLVDNDRVSLTNLNRQIIATRKTIGRSKVEVMRERILDINPEADVRIWDCFFLPENADRFPFEEYDYVVDAVDTVTAKLALVMCAQEEDIPIISSMGAGNKLDATAFRVADIYDTKVCPLARVMRRELKKRGVERLKVVYSEEPPSCTAAVGSEKEPIRPAIARSEEPLIRSAMSEAAEPLNGSGQKNDYAESAELRYAEMPERDAMRRSVPGSVAFVPSVAGLIIAGEVVKDLAGLGNCRKTTDTTCQRNEKALKNGIEMKKGQEIGCGQAVLY